MYKFITFKTIITTIVTFYTSTKFANISITLCIDFMKNHCCVISVKNACII